MRAFIIAAILLTGCALTIRDERDGKKEEALRGLSMQVWENSRKVQGITDTLNRYLSGEEVEFKKREGGKCLVTKITGPKRRWKEGSCGTP